MICLKKTEINKLIIAMLTIFLLIGNVSAFFPATKDFIERKQYTEICPLIEKQTFLSKTLPFLFKPRIFWKCNFIDKVEDNLGYDSSSDIIRSCYRACWSENLKFDEMQFPLLDSPKCLCTKENSAIQIQVKYKGGSL